MTQHQYHDVAIAGPGMRARSAEERRSTPLANAAAVPARRVGIIGASATGIHVAGSLLAADIPVTLYEAGRAALDNATASMRSGYEAAVGDGELTAGQRDRRVALLAATINLHHLKDCDVIVDASRMDPDAKEALLRRLNEVARPDAILLADIAHGDVDRIAALARFPANVLGFRLSEGAKGGQVWELVPGKATSRGALATAARLVANLGMVPGTVLPPAMSLA